MIKTLENTFRRIFPKRITNWKNMVHRLADKSGIEIGGPSAAFSETGFLPIYKYVKSLDGCNFSSNTVWEGKIEEGNNYVFGNKKGFQYISDGSDLHQIPDEKYDFVLSCHSIEHIANPIKAVLEWKRIIKNDGYLVLIIPHKDQTFDHKRPVTKLEHLIQDYENQTPETDNTHFEEVNTLHDIQKDDGIEDLASLKERTKNNFENRCVHHHVFTTDLIVDLMDHIKFEIITVQHFNPFHIVIMLKKLETNQPNNLVFKDKHHPIYQNPKFPSDRATEVVRNSISMDNT